MKFLISLRRLLVGICAGVGLVFLLASLTPFVTWYGLKLAGNWADPAGDTLIVLGGGDLLDGIPSQDTLFRCIAALRAYKAGHFQRIVVVGSLISTEMRDLLAWRGVPVSAILIEGASRSTRENALYTARILADDGGSKVLLTAAYHMFRAARAFRKAGVNVLARPIPDAIKRAGSFSSRWGAFQDEMLETAKIVYYRLRGWI
jgi:uncharacterized SAM-binding protein YcdF (DUF218 family)